MQVTHKVMIVIHLITDKVTQEKNTFTTGIAENKTIQSVIMKCHPGL